ncbi:MAG: hypothetical protein H6736_02405 [Alphaproteobacteria bacterium]|nr:hypothetical protein [Alphaproteobacteria bacterium]MCB9690643.1 hypothetical protein [Alphaproteobacteria bacterium]
MRLLKDIYGASVSALITGFLFLGPAILGLIYSLVPVDMVETLVVEERPPVYFDGAFELAEKEVDGDLDGTQEAPAPETPETQDDPQEGEGGDPNGEAAPDASDAAETQGGDLVADASLAVAGAGAAVGEKAGGRAVKGDGAKGRTKKRSRQKCPKSYDGIELRQDGVYEVDRAIVNYHTASVDKFNELGWSRSNDKGDGWVVSGFDCRGPLWHGGLRRGDVVLAVNGKKTNNMLQILRLYPKLRAQKKFEVDILRNGRSVRLRYEIVRG